VIPRSATTSADPASSPTAGSPTVAPVTADLPSFSAFFAAEYPHLVTLALTLTGSRATAEELASDAMFAAYRQWGRVSTMEFPAAYVRRSCANLATSAVRRRIAEGKALIRLAMRPSAGSGMQPEDEEFWAQVRRLPKRQAQVVALHYGCDLAVAEVGVVLGIAEGSVKSHLSRARTALAARLGETEGAGS
jgi:RNA polymerase sigma-70 factor (ECF subfamily)